MRLSIIGMTHAVKVDRGARLRAAAAAVVLAVLAMACAWTAVPSPAMSTGSGAAIPAVSELTSIRLATTSVPAAAWIDPDRLPASGVDHWPAFAAIAGPPTGNAFRAEDLCQITAPAKRLIGADGIDVARARADNSADQWSVQQQILHYPGDPWTMGQTAHQLFTELHNVITHCATSATGTRLTVTTAASHCPSIERGGCKQFAASIENLAEKRTAHLYLAVVGSSVTELSLWTANPSPVPPPDDTAIFSAMNPQLCKIWEC
ncbi:metallo-beta-lactamase superfamily protein,putative [Mycolicibacterium fortuitum]|uniref:Metallo-beta-lactamase superfamily protein,putative n=1 Tax=Mycolicibacterium fortuitum TaxID=1766 RepID=A0A378WCJ3_MYCFO|nr:metallo-beta-lactamase superfamily protein,putative [Mycolicibacterium fortuitum]